MSVSNAKKLLQAAENEPRLRRHLLVAAAIRELLSVEPVVVGGTAEEFWTADEYHETDLDLCAPLRSDEEKLLGDLGFVRDTGRHLYHAKTNVVVEFPDTTIDGDTNRVRREDLGLGKAAIIGVDDLYLDRLRQATVSDYKNDIHFMSALSVAAARYEDIDWKYVKQRIKEIEKNEPLVGQEMRRRNSLIRRRARHTLAESG